MSQLDFLMLALWSVPPALQEVGLEDAALEVRRRATHLDDPNAIEDLAILLGRLGVELAHAFVRARRFTKRAPDGIRDDAVKFEQDVFAARCWVLAARAAARRVMRGEAWMLN